jgi:hypothetical protein
MRASTAYNHQDRAVRQMADLYSSAKRFGTYTSKQLTTKGLDILKTIGHCPQHVVSHVWGYRAALDDSLRSELVFFYTYKGTLMSVDRKRDDYYEKLGVSVRDIGDAEISGHYWVIGDTIRPFFTSDNS